MRRVLLVLGASLLPSVASAAWTEFLPRSVRNGVYLELFGSYEQDDGGLGLRPYRWSDGFLREKATFYSNGYSYAPQFLQYHLSLTGALKQEDYESSLLPPSGTEQGTGLEYEARLYLLPEHSYNLQLFALRHEPLFKERAATAHESVQESLGGSLRYRKKPYFFHAGYVDNEYRSTRSASDDDTRQSTLSSSNVEKLTFEGQFFDENPNGRQLSLTAFFSPTWFRDSLGLDGTESDAQAGGSWNTKTLRWSANVTRNTFTQERGTLSDLESRRFGVYALANLYLPKGFRTDLSYRRDDNESTQPGSLPPTRSDDGHNLQADLVHRLYQSLDSIYSFLYTDRTSSGGETTARSHTLSFNYNKGVPTGRLYAGLSGGRGTTDNTGRTDIANEPHPAVSVPGSFTLLQRDVLPGSVSVFLRSPLPPFEAVLLLENVHYTLTPFSGTLEVDVLTLPAQFVVPGSYDFFATYSLTSGDFGLNTSSLNANLSVQLFDNLLTPYWGYSTVRSEVTQGTFPGTPLDSTTYTVGLALHRGGFRARGEYQKVEWEVSPYESWKAEAQYVGAAGRNTNVYLTASHQDKRFFAGTSNVFGAPHDDQITTATGNVQQRFFSSRMSLSAGGSYSLVRGINEGSAYSLNGSLTWKIGRLILEAGATGYASDTRGPTAVTSNRDHQYYYVKLRRDFF